MESDMDLKLCLSQRLIISGADSHLYRIGLSFEKPSPDAKRNLFREPLFVLYLSVHLFIHQTVILLVPQRDQTFHVSIGDVGTLMGAKVPLSQACALLGLLALISQVFNYVNYKNGVKSSELDVFRMMSGQLTPDSLGIRDIGSLLKLRKVSRKVFKMTETLAPTLKYWVFFTIALVLYTKTSGQDFLIGLPYALLWPILAQNSFNIIIYQFVYYFLLTYYLKLKLKQFNKLLSGIVIMLRMKNLRNMISKMRSVVTNSHKLYSEISEYNVNYWSKFLGSIWVVISMVISSTLYVTFYGKIIVLLRIPFGLFAAIYLVILLIIIHISSIIYHQSKRSYILLNSIFAPSKLTHTRHLAIKVRFSF